MVFILIRKHMKSIIQVASELDIRTPEDDVVRAISILLNRFAYDFSEENREKLQDILEENQPV